MAKIIVNNNVTLDGVMQGPARPDEDERGSFTHGGWALPYADATAGKLMAESGATTGALLFGRRTYEDFHSVWPRRTDGNPFTPVLNNARKYVASRTLSEPLLWENSILLQGDAADAVAALRAQEEKDIVLLGSGDLIQSLMRRNLIDRYVLLIHPLTLGSGRRLFPDGAPPAKLRLVSAAPTSTGVIVATYEPVGAEPSSREA
jgi:dihydrofolate reductase